MKRAWSDSRVLKAAQRIDALIGRAEDLVRSIREESRHPLAIAIADEIQDQCLQPASAREVVEDLLSDEEAA